MQSMASTYTLRQTVVMGVTAVSLGALILGLGLNVQIKSNPLSALATGAITIGGVVAWQILQARTVTEEKARAGPTLKADGETTGEVADLVAQDDVLTSASDKVGEDSQSSSLMAHEELPEGLSTVVSRAICILRRILFLSDAPLTPMCVFRCVCSKLI